MEPASPDSPRPAFVRRVAVRYDSLSESQQASGNSQKQTSILQPLEPLRSTDAAGASAPRSSRSCPPGGFANSRGGKIVKRQQSWGTPRGRNSEVLVAQDSGNPNPRHSQDGSESLPLGTQQLPEEAPRRSSSFKRRQSLKSSIVKTLAVVRIRGHHLNASESPAAPKVAAKPKVMYNMEDAIQPKMPVLSFNHEHQRHFRDLPEDTRDLQAHYRKEESFKHGISYKCPLCGDAHIFRLGQESDCV